MLNWSFMTFCRQLFCLLSCRFMKRLHVVRKPNLSSYISSLSCCHCMSNNKKFIFNFIDLSIFLWQLHWINYEIVPNRCLVKLKNRWSSRRCVTRAISVLRLCVIINMEFPPQEMDLHIVSKTALHTTFTPCLKTYCQSEA